MPPFQIKDGDYTSTIYRMIKDGRFTEAIRILQYELQRLPDSRAALSLLAYCYYNTFDYLLAAECYERLAQLHAVEHPEYKLYQAQALYNASLLPEAVAVLSQIDDPKLEQQVLKLDAAIKYREDDLGNARILVSQFSPDDPDAVVNSACLDFKEGKYAEALEKFTKANTAPTKPTTHGGGHHHQSSELGYALALCHYQLGDYGEALKHIAEIVERGVRDYPELGVGASSEGLEMRSVGNTQLLQETALVEACNLKFAIEYKMKNYELAAEALSDMPPRSEEELDPVTLHNQALVGMEKGELSDSFAKLQYLLGLNPFPPETFANLLLLYCRHDYYDLAADLLAENAHLTYKMLSPYLYDYLDALISQQSSSGDAFAKFDTLVNEQAKTLRRCQQNLEELRERGNGGGGDVDVKSKKAASGKGGPSNAKELQRAVEELEAALEHYLPVLMSQARILWERADYAGVERLFKRSAELCSTNETWALNLAHILFMQEKYKESAECYAPLVRAKFESMLDVSAVVLANLCVCYIMTNSNEEAEEIMKRVEREEGRLATEDGESAAGAAAATAGTIPTQQKPKQHFHLSIINLVIGTLYCSKGNYEFGMSRIVRALEPCEAKLGADTWYYSKRCMLSMLENIAKGVIVVRDDVLGECLHFLEDCEAHGRDIRVELQLLENPLLKEGKGIGGQGGGGQLAGKAKRTVTQEARLLKALLLKILD